MNFKPFTSVRIDESVRESWAMSKPWTAEADLRRLAEQQTLDWQTAVAIERGLITSNNKFRYVDLVIATPRELGAEVKNVDSPVEYTWYEKVCEVAIRQGLALCDTRVLLAFVLEHRPGVVPQVRRRGCYSPVMKTIEWEGNPRIIEIDSNREMDRFELGLSRGFLTSVSNHGHWKMDEELIFVKPRVDCTDQCRQP